MLAREPGQQSLGREFRTRRPGAAGSLRDWTRAAQIQMFNSGDLWSTSTAPAEQFLTYGFRPRHDQYTDRTTRTVIVAKSTGWPTR